MIVLQAHFEIDDAADPPRVLFRFLIDGQEAARAEQEAAGQWLSVLNALGGAAGLDLRTHVVAALTPMILRIQASIAAGDEAHAARVASLAEWVPLIEEQAG